MSRCAYWCKISKNCVKILLSISGCHGNALRDFGRVYGKCSKFTRGNRFSVCSNKWNLGSVVVVKTKLGRGRVVVIANREHFSVNVSDICKISSRGESGVGGGGGRRLCQHSVNGVFRARRSTDTGPPSLRFCRETSLPLSCSGVSFHVKITAVNTWRHSI